MNTIRIALISLLVAILPGLAHAAEFELTFNKGWVQEGPPNARVLAGFMQITNISKKTISITAADSDLFESIEFHRTVHADGMARMLEQPELTIKPGATLTLEHGSYHLMLINPHSPLKSGDSVELNLSLSTGACISIMLPVRQPQE